MLVSEPKRVYGDLSWGNLRGILSTTVVHEPNREDIMTDKKKDSERTDQDKSEETAMDRKPDQITNKAARKGIKSEQRFDEEHGIFTK